MKIAKVQKNIILKKKKQRKTEKEFIKIAIGSEKHDIEKQKMRE